MKNNSNEIGSKHNEEHRLKQTENEMITCETQKPALKYFWSYKNKFSFNNNGKILSDEYWNVWRFYNVKHGKSEQR